MRQFVFIFKILILLLFNPYIFEIANKATFVNILNFIPNISLTPIAIFMRFLFYIGNSLILLSSLLLLLWISSSLQNSWIFLLDYMIIEICLRNACFFNNWLDSIFPMSFYTLLFLYFSISFKTRDANVMALLLSKTSSYKYFIKPI